MRQILDLLTARIGKCWNCLRFDTSTCARLKDRDMTPRGTPSLSDMAGAAVKRLKRNREKGFFLMVEGARTY